MISVFLMSMLTACLFWVFNKLVPNPYMDEIFHVPQAQQYCNGNFSYWDNKITTLPGLYIVSQIIIYPMKSFVAITGVEFCSTQMLRSTNLILMLGNTWVLKKLIVSVNKSSLVMRNKESGDNKKTSDLQDDHYIELQAFTLSLFPLMFFFNFLYYTDIGSTFFVLASYYYTLEKYHITSSILGLIAICFRQTNVVWIVFNAGVAIYCDLQEKKSYSESDNIFDELHILIKQLFFHIIEVIKIGLPYAAVLLLFIGFVFINNGIVVGDRSSHEATLNIPQIMYFALLTSIFASYKVINLFKKSEVKNLINMLYGLKSFVFVFVALLFIIFGVKNYTQVHKYILADNRHYTFYIWRRIIDRTWYSRFALIPIYLSSFIFLLWQLSSHVKPLWTILFFICSVIVLVPQKLLEFRYFIIPYLLYRLHIKPSNGYEIIFEQAVYVMVNIITFVLFIYYPFQWENDNVSYQRFMW